MNEVSRFTVSVPAPMLEALDRELVRPGETRSATVRRLLQAALREAAEQDEVDRYIQGYREQPQTEEEFGWLDEAVKDSLAAVPWQ